MSIQLGGTIKLGTSSGTAVDYSTYISQMTIHFVRDTVEIPATFGAPIKSQSAAAENNTLEIQFYSTTAAASVWHEVYNAFKTSTANLYFEGLYNTAAAGTDNERWSGFCVVTSIDTPGAVGDLRQQSVTYPITAAGVTRGVVEMKARIEVEGARELRAALEAAGDDAADLKDANREAGDIVAGEARIIVPKRSGALAGSIRASRAKASATVRAGGAGLPYAAVIHFGWPGHNIEPQPFLYEALDTRRQDVIAAYEKAMQKITDRI